MGVVVALTWASVGHSEQSVNSEEGVEFIVPIERERFSEHAIFTVRLWNVQQLELSGESTACTMSYDRDTETERIECPEGIEHEKPIAEEWSLPVQDAVPPLAIRSHTMKVGERYRLRISGTSSDNCNTTVAEVRSIADSETIQLQHLSWSSTLMGCP